MTFSASSKCIACEHSAQGLASSAPHTCHPASQQSKLIDRNASCIICSGKAFANIPPTIYTRMTPEGKREAVGLGADFDQTTFYGKRYVLCQAHKALLEHCNEPSITPVHPILRKDEKTRKITQEIFLEWVAGVKSMMILCPLCNKKENVYLFRTTTIKGTYGCRSCIRQFEGPAWWETAYIFTPGSLTKQPLKLSAAHRVVGTTTYVSDNVVPPNPLTAHREEIPPNSLTHNMAIPRCHACFTKYQPLIHDRNFHNVPFGTDGLQTNIYDIGTFGSNNYWLCNDCEADLIQCITSIVNAPRLTQSEFLKWLAGRQAEKVFKCFQPYEHRLFWKHTIIEEEPFFYCECCSTLACECCNQRYNAAESISIVVNAIPYRVCKQCGEYVNTLSEPLKSSVGWVYPYLIARGYDPKESKIMQAQAFYMILPSYASPASAPATSRRPCEIEGCERQITSIYDIDTLCSSCQKSWTIYKLQFNGAEVSYESWKKERSDYLQRPQSIRCKKCGRSYSGYKTKMTKCPHCNFTQS